MLLVVGNLFVPQMATASQNEQIAASLAVVNPFLNRRQNQHSKTPAQSPTNQSSIAALILTSRDTLAELKGLLEAAKDKDADSSVEIFRANQTKLSKLNAQLKELHHSQLSAFGQTRQRLNSLRKSKRLNLKQSEELINRHDTAVDDYEKNMGQLMSGINGLMGKMSTADALVKVSELLAFLNSKQLRAGHETVNPSQMPFRTPTNNVRAPLAKNEDISGKVLMIKHAKTHKMEPTAEYLAETEDIVLTPEIRSTAQSLEHNPAKIYNWVRNNIMYVPSYGSIQGAAQTLSSRNGNAMDTASLLIALLRASGIHARYRYGTIDVPPEAVMNWVGGVTNTAAAQNLLGQGGIPNVGIVNNGELTHIRIEHVWVEAWVDFSPSRGIKHREGDAWIPLDAAFKQYHYPETEDPLPLFPFDEDQLANSLQTLEVDETNIRFADTTALREIISQKVTEIKNYVETQPEVNLVPSKTVTPIPEDQVLSAGLPYKVVARGESVAELPNHLRYQFRVEIVDRFDTPLISYTASTPALAGKELGMGFTANNLADAQLMQDLITDENGEMVLDAYLQSFPGYLINLQAEVLLDGNVVKAGGNMTMGQELRELKGYWVPNKGWELSESLVVAGEMRAIGLNLQGVSTDNLSDIAHAAGAEWDKIVADDPNAEANLRRLGGSKNQLGINAYMMWIDNYSLSFAAGRGIVEYVQPSFGAYGLKVTTDYLFGLPSRASYTGVQMDVDQLLFSAVSKNNDPEPLNRYLNLRGMMASNLEHTIPELLLSTEETQVEGVSTSKAMMIASGNGQKLFHIDSSNMGEVLPQLRIDSLARAEIIGTVNSGGTAMVHESPVQVRAWVGSGYILLDPATGATAYKISGGANGGAATFQCGGASKSCVPEGTETAVVSFLVATISEVAGIANAMFKTMLGFGVASVLLNLLTVFASCGSSFGWKPYIIVGLASVVALGLELLAGALISALTLGFGWILLIFTIIFVINLFVSALTLATADLCASGSFKVILPRGSQ